MGKIRVRMISAQNLVSADLNGYSDPYVVIAVAGEEKQNFKKTAIIKKNLNPSWNESFEFDLGATPTHRQLSFHVYDWDMLSSDDPLGNVSLSVDDLFKDEEKLQWYNLHNTKHGEIQVGLTALDFGIDRAAQQFQQQQHQQGYPQQDYSQQQQGYPQQQQGYDQSYGQHEQGYPAQGVAPAPTYGQPVHDVGAPHAENAARGNEHKNKDGKIKAGKVGKKAGKAAGTLLKGLAKVVAGSVELMGGNE